MCIFKHKNKTFSFNESSFKISGTYGSHGRACIGIYIYLGSKFDVSKRKPCEVKDIVTMLNKSLGIPGEEKFSISCGMVSIVTEEF